MSESKEEKKYSRRTFASAIVGTAAVAGLAGLSGGYFAPRPEAVAPAEAPKKPLKIGLTAPLTGSYAGEGISNVRGSTMLVDQINSEGGVDGRNLELVVIDIEDKAPEKVVAACERFCTQDKVEFGVGHYPSWTGSDFDVFAKYGIPYAAMPTTASIRDTWVADKAKYYASFMSAPTANNYAIGWLTFLEQQVFPNGWWKPPDKTVALLRAKNAYSMGIADAFRPFAESLGWKVVVDESNDEPTVEWGSILAKIRDTKPAMIFNTNATVPNLVTFMQQFLEAPTPTIIRQGWMPVIEVCQALGDKAKGLVWESTFDIIEDKQMGLPFRDAYLARWGEPPTGTAGGTEYNTMMPWVIAASRAADASDFKKVADQMMKVYVRCLFGTAHYWGDEYDPAWHYIAQYPDEVYSPDLGSPHQYYQIWTPNEKVGQYTEIGPFPYQKSKITAPPWFEQLGVPLA